MVRKMMKICLILCLLIIWVNVLVKFLFVKWFFVLLLLFIFCFSIILLGVNNNVFVIVLFVLVLIYICFCGWIVINIKFLVVNDISEVSRIILCILYLLLSIFYIGDLINFVKNCNLSIVFVWLVVSLSCLKYKVI